MGEDRSGKFHKFFFIYSPFLFYLSNKFLQLYRSSHYRDHELSIIRIVNRKRIGSADRLCRAVVLLVNTHLFGRPHIVGVQSRQREPSRFMCPKLAHSRALPSAWIADLAGHARLIVPPFVQGEIEGAHPHCKRELAVFFFRLFTHPFLNRDIKVSSLSISTSTATLSAACPNYTHPDGSIDMPFNICLRYRQFSFAHHSS